MIELTYPHFTLSQTGSFVSSDITFNQLKYEQFMAGEVSTIKRAKSKTEKEGRIRPLEKIMHWKLRHSVSWLQLRNVYAVILRDIENRMITWEGDFTAYQHLLTDRISFSASSNVNKNSKETKNTMVWFCKNYQKPEGCSKDSPHVARINNKERIVHHFCARCWLKEKVKKFYPESSMECPNYEQ